jgi:hypothetical protein
MEPLELGDDNVRVQASLYNSESGVYHYNVDWKYLIKGQTSYHLDVIVVAKLSPTNYVN